MNITEANAVNKVLQQLVTAVTTRGTTLSDEAVEASAMLADRANKVLHAGYTAESFRQAVTS